MSLQTVPACDLPPADLAAVWRAAYEGYYVPLQFDEAMLARHIRWSGIDLGLSVVGRVDGAPVGLSLAARDGGEAWIGGFGIAPAHRRRGFATGLIRAHAARLDAAGIERTRLEVIDINPAQEAYRRAGFETTRELVVLQGELGAGEATPAWLDRDALAEAHARMHPEPPSWRRTLPRLFNILDDAPAQVAGVRRNGRVAAFAVILNLPEKFGILDAAAEDESAAAALFEAVGSVRPGAIARLVDEPSTSPLASALEGLWSRTMRQFEMIRRRP